MKKIKVLQMPVRNAKGGITQYALRNWEHIDKSRFLFDWVTLDKELSFERELEAQACKVHHLSCRQEENETGFHAEMRKIFNNSYDVVHLHTSFWRGFSAEELAIEAKVPNIIVHAHSTGIDITDAGERAKLLKAHENWKAKFNTGLATRFTACSAPAADFLFGPQIPRRNIIILKNAIDTERFAFNAQTRAEVRKSMGLDDRYVILQPGRMEHQKNHVFTLKVFAMALEQLPDAILLLAGDGKLRKDLEKEAAILGIADKVRFLGFREDIPDLLQAADLTVLPSLFEGISIAAIEAQCSGVQCLLSAFIPQEAVVLENAKQLPLDKTGWVNEITRQSRNSTRNKTTAAAELRKKGWDLQEQIKVLENIYGGLN